MVIKEHVGESDFVLSKKVGDSGRLSLLDFEHSEDAVRRGESSDFKVVRKFG